MDGENGRGIIGNDPLACYRSHGERLTDAVRRVMESGLYILGPEVASFESEFAAYLGVEHVVGVASGTDALALALQAVGVRHGDGVCTVANTALATVASILQCGAQPVLVDIDPMTLTMSPSHLEATIRSSPIPVKAVVPVHLFGTPADMPALSKVTEPLQIPVIEDCAQAAGAAIDARKVGTLGVAAAFSFYPTKNLACLGDGGAVVTSNQQVGQFVRRARQYGWDEERHPQTVGVNSRMDEIQAAVLRIRLEMLDSDNERRVAIATEMAQQLPDSVRVQGHSTGTSRVFHQFTVLCSDRESLLAWLKGLNIHALVHYPTPIHLESVYGELCVSPKEGLPETEKAARQILSLPLHPHMTDNDVHRLSSAVKEWGSSGGV